MSVEQLLEVDWDRTGSHYDWKSFKRTPAYQKVVDQGYVLIWWGYSSSKYQKTGKHVELYMADITCSTVAFFTDEEELNLYIRLFVEGL